MKKETLKKQCHVQVESKKEGWKSETTKIKKMKDGNENK